LTILVDYFRRFEASDQLPQATDAAGLYRELSFEQKGVCRHRAYAFAITALALGLPTRVVHNEAHAWVEVFDTELWHRVDLGGAASDIRESSPDPLSPNHRPPQDPFAWPTGATSALDALPQRVPAPAEEEQHDLASDVAQSRSGDDSSRPGWPGATGPGRDDGASKALWGDDSTRTPDVTFSVVEKQLLRGRPLRVSGTAQKDGVACRLARVDVFYSGPEGRESIGSVATDREGRFVGSVTLPPSTPVGPLELSVELGAGCD
jgi:hypothetical protein